MIDISIIIPFHNGLHFLENCIDSVEEQGLSNYEILLISDRTDEDIQGFLKVYEQRRLPIQYMELKDKYGVAAARNKGIESASGKYIYFLDSDDYLFDGALPRILSLAEEKEADIVTGTMITTWFKRETFKREDIKEVLTTGVRKLDKSMIDEYFGEGFSTLHLLINREFLIKTGSIFDETLLYYSDAPFVLSLIMNTAKIWKDFDSLYAKRLRNDPIHFPSLSQLKDTKRMEDYLASYNLSLTIVKPETAIRILIQKRFCEFVLVHFQKRIRGNKVAKFAKRIRTVGKDVKIKFSFGKRLEMKFLSMGRYRLAHIMARWITVSEKKTGILGSKIQRYRFINKLIFSKLAIKDNWVFIESFFGKSYSDSSKYIYEYLLEHKDKNYRYIWCLNNKSKDVKGNPTIVKYNSLRYVYYTARAKYRVYNTRQPGWLKKRPGMIFLETWHGTPLKKLVFDIDDIHAASQNHKEVFYRQTRDWDYLISDNPFSTEIFERCFEFNKNKILEYGYPRNDILYAPNIEEIACEMKRQLGIPEGKRVILYAPTWRDDDYYGPGKYKFSLAMDLNLMKEEFGDDSVILLRAHYHIADNLDLRGLEGFVFNVSGYEDVSKIYIISDICITDYSSVFFDFANLKRPILFYVYDFDKYKDVLRGLYIDMEKELPGPLLYTNEDIVQTLHHMDQATSKYSERYEEFYQRFCCVDDGNASKRIVEKIFGA